MSARTISDSLASAHKIGRDNAPWVRNPSWLALPDCSGLQKFAGLHAVYPEGNFVALSAEGNFTVNWGDGSGDTNVSSGVTAERNIAWADADDTSDVGIAGAVSCTFTDSGDTVNRTAHGWLNGQKVAFATITSTTGIATYTTYYIVNKSADAFQVASTVGGTALTLTTDGSGTVYVPQYRQVVVTVVPNGGNLTKLDLQVLHSTSGLTLYYSSGWLDIVVSAQYLTDMRFGVGTPAQSSPAFLKHDFLEQFSVIASDMRQLSFLLYQCRALRSMPSLVTSSAPAGSADCTFTDSTDTVNLTAHGRRNGDVVFFTTINSTTGISTNTAYYVRDATADAFKLAGTYSAAAQALTTDGTGTMWYGTDFSGLLYSSVSISDVPLFDTTNGVTFFNMFSGCSALTSVALLDTSNGVIFSNMLASCSELKSVPRFVTTNGRLFSYMFSGCGNLRSVPLLNTANGLSFNFMLGTCYSLSYAPSFNTANGTNFASMFSGCYSLKEAPQLNVASGTMFSSMFVNCYVLSKVPLYNTAAGTNFSSMFASCGAISELPTLNVASGTSITSMFSGCRSMVRGTLVGTAQSISYADCKLSAAALDEIYTNLATVSAKTITVTGNYGNVSDDPSIATAKGWTVTG